MAYHTGMDQHKTPDQLWADIGSLSEDETFHVLTRLFAQYEARLGQDPEDAAARLFFGLLDQVITQTCQCNLNRR